MRFLLLRLLHKKTVEGNTGFPSTVDDNKYVVITTNFTLGVRIACDGRKTLAYGIVYNLQQSVTEFLYRVQLGGVFSYIVIDSQKIPFVRVEKCKEQIIDYYKSALEKEPLQLINHFIKEIQLYDDKMIIIYNTPKTINLDESLTKRSAFGQGFSFYDKNVKMPYVIQNREYYGLKDFRLIMRI